MRIAALVLGVIGGLYGLTVGWWIYALVSFGGGKDGVLALVVPLTGLIGGSLSLVAPSLAGGLMLLSASLTALVIGFNVFVAIPILLLGVGGVLALLGANETAGAGTNHGGPMHNRSGIDDLDRRVRSGFEAGCRRFKQALAELSKSDTTVPGFVPVGTTSHNNPEVHLVPSKGAGLITLSRRRLTNGGVVLGRKHSNDVVIDDWSISRVHARMWIDDRDRLMIEDLGSSNGTWCNELKVDRAVLERRSRLRLGDVTIAIDRNS